MLRDPGRTWEVARFLAPLAQGPNETGFHRIDILVHVVPVKAKPGFEPQRIARAEADGLYFGFGQSKGASVNIGDVLPRLRRIAASARGAQ